MQGAFLGPSYSQGEIEGILNQIGAKYHTYKKEEMIQKTAEALGFRKSSWLDARKDGIWS